MLQLASYVPSLSYRNLPLSNSDAMVFSKRVVCDFVPRSEGTLDK